MPKNHCERDMWKGGKIQIGENLAINTIKKILSNWKTHLGWKL